jgi:hypothetical protein
MNTRKIEKTDTGILIVEGNVAQQIPFGQTLYFIKYDDMSVGRVILTDKFLNNNLEVYEVFVSEDMRDNVFAQYAIDEDSEFKEAVFSGAEIMDALNNNNMADLSIDYNIIKNSIITYLKNK